MEMFSICWPQSGQPLLIQETVDEDAAPSFEPRCQHDFAAKMELFIIHDRQAALRRLKGLVACLNEVDMIGEVGPMIPHGARGIVTVQRIAGGYTLVRAWPATLSDGHPIYLHAVFTSVDIDDIVQTALQSPENWS